MHLRPRKRIHRFSLSAHAAMTWDSPKTDNGQKPASKLDLQTNASNDPLGSLDSIDNVDATLSYTYENYRVAVWGRNITDEREQRWATIGGITTRGWWNEPEMYGVTLSASF